MLTHVAQIVVLVFGIIVILATAWGILAPGKLMAFVASTMDRQWAIYVAVIVRLALGLALISVAPASRFPIVFQILGWIAIVAAVIIAAAGQERIRRFIAWWLERFSLAVVKLWLLFGMAFGGFIVYGVL